MKRHLFYVLMDRTSPMYECEKCLNTNAKSVFQPNSVRSEGRTSRSPVLQALKANFFDKETCQKPWNHPISGFFLSFAFDSFLMDFDPSKWVTMGDRGLNLSKWVTKWVTEWVTEQPFSPPFSWHSLIESDQSCPILFGLQMAFTVASTT